MLQHKDGKVRIAVWQDRVKVTANDTYFCVKDDGNIEAIAPKKILFDTPLFEMTGIFKSGTGKGGGGTSTINGALHTTQNVESDTDVKAQSVSLYSHVHYGVQPGGGITADPVK